MEVQSKFNINFFGKSPQNQNYPRVFGTGIESLFMPDFVLASIFHTTTCLVGFLTGKNISVCSVGNVIAHSLECIA